MDCGDLILKREALSRHGEYRHFTGKVTTVRLRAEPYGNQSSGRQSGWRYGALALGDFSSRRDPHFHGLRGECVPHNQLALSRTVSQNDSVAFAQGGRAPDADIASEDGAAVQHGVDIDAIAFAQISR